MVFLSNQKKKEKKKNIYEYELDMSCGDRLLNYRESSFKSS